MPSDKQSEPLERFASELERVLEQAGIYIRAEVRAGLVSIDGQVDSAENHDAALDVAAAMLGPLGLKIEDNLEIQTFVPGEDWPASDADQKTPLVSGKGVAIPDEGFTGDVESYFAPTDPVIALAGRQENLRVLGGFQATAMDDDLDGRRRGKLEDSDLQELVLRELRQDALTVDLSIDVLVNNGVVALVGEVDTLDDALNAEAVASRIEGVKQVKEELVVRSISTRPGHRR